MVKNVFLLLFVLSAVNIFAQNKNGIKEISIYKSPLLDHHLTSSVHSKIRSIRVNGENNYYLDLNEGNVYCTIKYENLESLISGIQRLETKEALDLRDKKDGVKNIVMTPKGFVSGYYLNKGKVKRFYGFGEAHSNIEDVNREFSTYEEDFDSFNSEKENYVTYKSRLHDFNDMEEFFTAVKDRIEEIKLSEAQL